MPTASLLTRISVDAEASDSVERQEGELRALADRLGATVLAVHADVGVSGASSKRPALDAWLLDAEEGRADLLLAWDWSRISRQGLKSAARVLDVLDRSGARLVTLRDNLDSSSPAFGITTAVMAETAKSERDAISARVSSRQAADRARGYWTKPRPFGFTVEGGKLVRHPDEAPILRELVDRYLAGASLRSLTIWLNEAGVAPQRADSWGLSSLRHILYSPSTAGMMPHKGDVVRDLDGEPVVVALDPIVSLPEHLQIKARARERRTSPTRDPSRPRHPLTALVRCGHCGGPMTFLNRASQRRASYFRCVGRSLGSGCEGRLMRADVLLDLVLARVRLRLSALDPDDPWLGDVAIRVGLVAKTVTTAELDAARAEYEDVAARLADAEDAHFNGHGFRGADGRSRFQTLQRKLGAQLDSLSAVLAQERPVVHVGALLDLDLDGVDDVALRKLLTASVETATVTGRASVNVAWRR